MKFQEEKQFLERIEKKESINNKCLATSVEIEEIKKEYPNVPEAFLEYLSEIGSGNIRESHFKVYPLLFDLNEIGISDVFQVPGIIRFFGDNYSGGFAGFDLSRPKDEVLEFWHDSNELYYTGKTFREYIREKIMITPSSV